MVPRRKIRKKRWHGSTATAAALTHFIDGEWQAPAAGQYFDTVDPSNGEKLAVGCARFAADVDAAVKAARAASPRWQALTSARPRALSLCHRAPGAKTFAAARGSRNDGQWQADSREP